MRAVRLSEASPIANKPLDIVEVKTPSAGRGQLLIKISMSGICRTDLHIVEGDILPPKLPLIPGHQVVGRVDSIGPEVRSWAVGDRVGVPWLYRACRTCTYCLRGEENRPVFLVLTHGDFCPANMVNTPHGIKIIDWEGVGNRSVLFDVYSYFFIAQ